MVIRTILKYDTYVGVIKPKFKMTMISMLNAPTGGKKKITCLDNNKERMVILRNYQKEMLEIKILNQKCRKCLMGLSVHGT